MTTIQCPTECTVTIQHEFVNPLFSLSTADGAQIAAAIVLVWTAGWAVRMAIKAMNVDRSSTSTSSDD